MSILKEQVKRSKELMGIITESLYEERDTTNIDLEATAEAFDEAEGDRPDNWRDLPGYNPEAFYGDGKLAKLRRLTQQQDEIEMSKEAIIEELVAIYSYSQDGAIDLVNSSLENLLSNLGHFKSE